MRSSHLIVSAQGVSGLLCHHLQHSPLFPIRRLRRPKNGIHQQLAELRVFEVVGMAEGSVEDAGLLRTGSVGVRDRFGLLLRHVADEKGRRGGGERPDEIERAVSF